MPWLISSSEINGGNVAAIDTRAIQCADIIDIGAVASSGIQR